MHRIVSLLIMLICWHIAPAQNKLHPCNAPECSQFDFWVGEWDLTWNDTSKGSNSIRKILNDCVINENFSNPVNNYSGMSWSVYDPQKREWKQTWVDNQNGYIILTGKYSNGEMILSTGPVISPQGKKVVSRMVFYHIKPDSFDWKWEASTDNFTWKVNWLIHYERKK